MNFKDAFVGDRERELQRRFHDRTATALTGIAARAEAKKATPLLAATFEISSVATKSATMVG